MWFIKIICVHSTQNTFVLSISFFNMKMCVAQALEQINVFASLFCCCRSRSCSRRRCCCCCCSDFHYNSSACFTRLHCHCAEYVQDYFAPSVSYFYEITFFSSVHSNYVRKTLRLMIAVEVFAQFYRKQRGQKKLYKNGKKLQNER